MYRPVFNARFYDDIDPVLVFFGHDLDIRIGVAEHEFAVLADIETALGNAVQVRDRLQKLCIRLIHLHSPLCCASTARAFA